MVTGGTQNQLLAALREIVGTDNVLTQSEARSKYANDQWWYAVAAAAAGVPVSVPHAAVLPGAPEEVANVVRLANYMHLPITPWGGGSGVQGAANADQGGLIMDLRRLNR